MKLRAFLAVEIPADIQRLIQQGTASLQEALPKPLVRWVETKNLHLTLKFLGDVSTGDLEKFASSIELELVTQAPFIMSVAGLGVFPGYHQPRIIWAGLKAPKGLSSLQQSVEAIAVRTDFSPEERPFSPHLTIGRVGQGSTQADRSKIRETLESATLNSIGPFNVKTVTIFKSDLRPTGPVYTSLYTLPMQP
jgi:RNA 2',3'-cyclic 3'-phosphodiesterase